MTKGPSSVLMVGSQTLFPGSSITIDGQEISLAATGGAVIVNPARPTATPFNGAPPPVISIGTSLVTANSNSGFVIGSQTLFPGGAITESGRIYTLPAPTPKPTTFQTNVALGTSAITNINVAGQTLTAGGRITVGNDILSIAPDGTGVIIIGTVTIGGGESTATATSGRKSSANTQKPSLALCACILFVTYIFV
ncbi:hypothetical protein GLAREA_07521 [Glarea lozoyensis ATCC 20868]|uniref:Uncharacterized protein n=1 Tax=Glarea lozoyensis (strain ATCC 20868 / MF5171) TaxID=1116229 RepID=S3E1N2_GLAL2|nr:uncharacterized protein GLAREA_07521 [Glarea lozoyensis ATCC 20868]EPE32388.1 hypothetical protein GLAREA_07521 [Glarea lozoyensis ATCC 20868]